MSVNAYRLISMIAVPLYRKVEMVMNIIKGNIFTVLTGVLTLIGTHSILEGAAPLLLKDTYSNGLFLGQINAFALENIIIYTFSAIILTIIFSQIISKQHSTKYIVLTGFTVGMVFHLIVVSAQWIIFGFGLSSDLLLIHLLNALMYGLGGLIMTVSWYSLVSLSESDSIKTGVNGSYSTLSLHANEN